MESFEDVCCSKLLWLVAIFVLIYLYFKKVVYSYWERLGVPQDDFTVPTGIFNWEFLTRKITFGNVFKSSYEKFKKHPYHGVYIFHNRALMVNDPELIKQILVKDFASFCDRGLYSNYKIDPLSGHLFFISGDKWRALRAKLSPTFTSGKLRHMFPIVKDIADEMVRIMDENLEETNVFEMKDLVARYTTDTIFSLAFGLDSNCLREESNEFRNYGNLSVVNNIIRSSLGLLAPRVLDLLRIPFTDPRLSKFFIQLFRDVVDERRAGNVKRQDFLNSLIDLMDHEQIVDAKAVGGLTELARKIAKRLQLTEAAAQAYAFFVAGFETSSTTITHCLYELALNPDVQDKVHAEIDESLESSDGLTYESLTKLEYLDMTFQETMRKHSSVPALFRVCNSDYKIPNSDVTIPKGTNIMISISGLHRDPNIYPDPENFDPTRFSPENTAARHPYAYLPFGEGPRICIAKRLGVLQTKVALFSILSRYKLSVCDKTPITSEYAVESLFQTPSEGIYLKVERRKPTSSCRNVIKQKRN